MIPSARWFTFVAVVGLARALSLTLEAGATWIGAPEAVLDILIAALVPPPRSVEALRAARANRLQTSMNLALASALASIGLTMPVVVVIAIAFDQELSLGPGPKEKALLAPHAAGRHDQPWAPAAPWDCRASCIQ